MRSLSFAAGYFGTNGSPSSPPTVIVILSFHSTSYDVEVSICTTFHSPGCISPGIYPGVASDRLISNSRRAPPDHPRNPAVLSSVPRGSKTPRSTLARTSSSVSYDCSTLIFVAPSGTSNGMYRGTK